MRRIQPIPATCRQKCFRFYRSSTSVPCRGMLLYCLPLLLLQDILPIPIPVSASESSVNFSAQTHPSSSFQGEHTGQEEPTYLLCFVSVLHRRSGLSRPCVGSSIFSFCRPFVLTAKQKYRFSASYTTNDTDTVFSSFSVFHVHVCRCFGRFGLAAWSRSLSGCKALHL